VPHITIEYVLLIPVLFIQVIVFPFAANMMATAWTNSHREAELQDAADHLASTIQQFYLSINRKEISAGNVTQASTLPPIIQSYPYKATGSLRFADSSGVLTLLLELVGTKITVTSTALLGSNVLWVEESVFESTSSDASIRVQKFANGTLLFSFGS
jgi:hypothetical protein